MTSTTLEAYLLAAMHAWAPTTQHAYKEAAAITEARYQAIASDIASVALDPEEAPLFEGHDARVRTATLLLAVASLESGGFRGDVAFCQRAGDGGRAWGLYQSHRAAERVCTTVREATRVALEQMRESFSRCSSEEGPVRLAAYVSGSCGRGWFSARMRWDRADGWLKAHPVI